MDAVAFKGGKKLEEYLLGVAEKVSTGKVVQVGFFEGATYDDGTPVAMVAAIQNYGAPGVGVPPRPFFSSMIAAKKDEWGPAIAGLLKRHGYDAQQALSQTGAAIAGQLADSIVATSAPPLSPVTLMLRKMRREDQSLVVTKRIVREAAARVAAGESTGGEAAKPLVDTGHLLASIDYEVSE